MASYGAFASVALVKAIIGLPSCGCFGNLHVKPAYTAMLDVSLVLGLALFPPPNTSRVARRAGYLLAGLALLSVVGILAARNAVRASAYARLEDLGTTSGSLVLLEPEKWAGKPFPLAGHLDLGERLATGQWTLILYHFDCPVCREVISAIERGDRGDRVALIEMPPYAPPGESPVSANSHCLLGQLSDKLEWFATTPVVVELRDGIVVSALQGEEAAKAILHH